ncbi:unnamed protein product [Adineta steineri]|uniref:SHSP domain-containing protein n=1 Tax=Adineta steineri TaxID=433720 RepID=A0A815JQ32_9BILA|nr:unnamed protein product [Adineta steineri]CAF1548013.1 unnamed protein product [Adineta steineri]
MDKIPGIGANLVKTVTNLIDSKEEKSQDNALSTVLGSLKLYDDNSPRSTLSSKYRSTETLYDIVIRINNISDLRTQGWEILVGKHAKNILPIRMILDRNASTNSLPEKKQGVIATALGAYNRGKSFLLKKLCKIELPNGNLISTEDTPVKNEEIEFKRATEALLREVVLHLSTFIIIVVNRLRATDQIYIKEILKYCRNTPNKKSVIIVHNFVDIETIEDLDKIIENEVKNIFGAKLETLQLVVNRTAKSINYFTSYQSGIDVRHYILAKSRSNAADHWNKQTLDGIMNLLQNSENKQSLDIINDMIHFINTKLPQLFKQDNHYENSLTSQNIEIVQHNSQPYIVHSDRQHREDLLKDPLSLKLAEKLVYDDAGYFIRNESGQWQPRYNLYDDKDNHYLVVEAAGFRKGELKTSRTDKSISIEGTRLDLTKGMINPTIRQSDIPVGSFKLNIPFKKDINPDGVEIERDEGLLRFTIPKKKTNQIDEAV